MDVDQYIQWLETESDETIRSLRDVAMWFRASDASELDQRANRDHQVDVTPYEHGIIITPSTWLGDLHAIPSVDIAYPFPVSLLPLAIETMQRAADSAAEEDEE